MITRYAVLGVTIAGTFLVGRTLHGWSGRSRPVLAADPARGSIATGDVALGRGPLGHPTPPVVAAPRPARDAPPDEREQVVRATAIEAEDARVLRREAQVKAIREHAPDLPGALVDQLVAIGDRLSEQGRGARASFVLGEVSEEDYIAVRQQTLVDAVEAARGVLTRDQFERVYQWKYDADPYDPDGSLQAASVAAPATYELPADRPSTKRSPMDPG
jgi:hypothetical protein